MRKRVFVLELDHEEGIDAPSEIFVPVHQYPRGYRVEVSDGSWETREGGRVVAWRHGESRRRHRIVISPGE
jgi:hypothetical protein